LFVFQKIKAKIIILLDFTSSPIPFSFKEKGYWFLFFYKKIKTQSCLPLLQGRGAQKKPLEKKFQAVLKKRTIFNSSFLNFY